MAALTPVRSPSGIVAIAERPDNTAAMFSGEPLVLVATDIQDPGNVGAVIRVAEAAGASGVVVSGASADPFGWKALRGSMGSALRLPIAINKESDVFDGLRRRGCRIVATSPQRGRPLSEANLRGAIALVIGGEGSGLSPRHLADADDVVTIPMRAPVESLNAAVTAALLVYEARRQRS
jgi:RNA methyltransferase, TrmH family